ncbi:MULTISPECIES: ATP-binding protein [Aeromonas]|uniref:ATP-binding protein n=1 Tax=Aeromonas TaxID=642 RepID=UPI0021E6BFC6|nr:ATP-binding protein [Aeromonas hydrophila]MCV3275938.1 ATP-binding protein [Aeromonas hydrophila]
MIKINKILIHGFKAPNRTATVNFSEKQTSVIYGNNGSGKTTFLKILNAIFTKNEGVLISESVEKIEIEYSIKKPNKKTKHDRIEISKEAHLQNQSEFGIEELDLFDDAYDWGAYDSSELASSRSLTLGIERGGQSPRLNVSPRILTNYLMRDRRVRYAFSNGQQLQDFCTDIIDFIKNRGNRGIGNLKSTNSISFDMAHVFLKSLNMENVETTLLNRYRNARRNAAIQVQKALFDTLSSAITSGDNSEIKDPIDKRYYKQIYKNKDLIIEALDDNLENKFKNSIVRELHKIKVEDDIDELSHSPLLIKLLGRMAMELKSAEKELSAINTVFDKFKSFTLNQKSIEISNSKLVIKLKDGEHSISELSSGERHILTLLTLLLDESDRNFLIIDEPEISLNAKWQEELMPTLSQLLPHTQIIVASHSPMIAESIDNLAPLELNI